MDYTAFNHNAWNLLYSIGMVIAVETRQHDCEDCMQAIHDEDTWQMFLTERSFLRAIGGGCNEAAAVDVRMDGRKVSVRARYAGDFMQHD